LFQVKERNHVNYLSKEYEPNEFEINLSFTRVVSEWLIKYMIIPKTRLITLKKEAKCTPSLTV
jgi:hypothetical protein